MAANPYQCDHADTEIRKRKDAAGRWVYQRQCVACGRSAGSLIALKKVPNVWAVKEWDEAIEAEGRAEADRECQERREAWSQEREQQSAERWAAYNAYLQTAKWFGKRARVLERDNYVCQACLHGKATQVHHLTYAHIFNEPLFDLVSVCQVCHEAITKMDREARGAVTA